MAKTSKDYFNDGYYEAMNDLMTFIQGLNAKKVEPSDFKAQLSLFAMHKRPKETYTA